jgi:tubulin polyglutamylase TTLL5
MACLAMHAAEAQEIAIDAGLITVPAGQTFLVGNFEPAVHDALTLALSAYLNAGHSRGALLTSGNDHQILALGLPLQVPADASGAGCFLPASPDVSGRRYPLSAVLIPSTAELSEEDGLRTLPVNEALKQLIGGCCSAVGRPLDSEGFNRLAQWLESCDRYLVDMNNIEAAVAALTKRFSTAQPQESQSL